MARSSSTWTGRALLSLLISLLSVASLSGCKKKATATADCTNLERYQSRFGVLNAPQFSLGTILDVNLTTKAASRLFTIVPTSTEIDTTAPIDTTEIISSGDFKVTVDAKVPAIVTAQVSTEINNNTLFSLLHHRRQNITDPIRTVRSHGRDQELIGMARSRADHALVIVDGLVLADDLKFKLKNGYDVKTGVNTIKFGKYSVQVTYSCEGGLRQVAHQGPLFFKAGRLAVMDSTLALTDLGFDFKDINMTATMTAH